MKDIALDIETTGLYPIKGKDKIWCVSLNDGKKITFTEQTEQVRKICEDPSICKIIHNAAFDAYWLKALHNITVRNIWDTKLMEQVIIGDNLISEENATEEQKLELSSSLYYTLKRYKLPVHSKTLQSSFATRPRNKPLTKDEIEYAKNDVRYLHHIKALQTIRLNKLNLTRVGGLENKVVEIVVRMRYVGITIDLQKWKQIENFHLSEKLRLLKRLPASVSNWNSPKQAKKYFNSIGIPIKSLEELKAPPGETSELVDKYNSPILNMYIEMRKHSTMVSKYGEQFLHIKEDKKKGKVARYLVDPDGRIRANLFQILNSGRFSCSEPPLHGLPRDSQDESLAIWDHRSAFIPRKGCVFVGGDFGGQELGVMSAASNETTWIKALLRGEDPLSLMASIMFPDWTKSTEKGCTFPKKCKCKKHKVYRQTSKEVTYGLAYGAKAKKTAKKVKRTEQEVRKLMYKHTKAAPNLARWLAKNAAESIRHRISYSADTYKRRRTIRDAEEWMVRNVGYNNPVQSTAANMLKLAMVSLDEKWVQVFPWHDALYLEVPIKQAKQAAKELKIVMEKAADYCTGISGLIKVEPSITKSLAK